METRQKPQLRIIAGIIVIFASLLTIRLYYVQIIHGAEYAEAAEGQYVDRSTVFDRGNVHFTAKDGSLVAAATLASGYTIAIDPRVLADAPAVAEKIGAIVPIDRVDFLKRAESITDPYEVVLTRATESEGNAIEDLDIPGVIVSRDQWRTYPGGTLAAQIIGFIGYGAEGSDLTGRYGIERQYDAVLSRAERDQGRVNFFAELFGDISTVVFDRGDETEGDVVLSIEPSVQATLEEELEGVMREWKSDLSGGIIMDPKTGAIIAMAGAPGFDLNDYGKVEDPRVFKNPNIENLYEMGSTVKPLTMAAGIDAGAVNATSVYNDPGVITLDRSTIGNFDGRARGPGTTMQQVLSESLNTGVAYVVGKLGNQRFAEYMLSNFRIGEETGIDLPSEAQGRTVNLTSTRDIEYATASYGHGISMTPINITTALASLGNGGIVPTPSVVREIRYLDGRVRGNVPPPGGRAISAATSEEITRMLVTVVDKALLGGSVRIPEYSIAAKTGTALLPKRGEGERGYYDDRYLHSFFGYFPAYDPKFIIFLYTVDPQNATFASHTLTSPFMRLTKFLIHYYDIPPDRDPTIITRAALRRDPE